MNKQNDRVYLQIDHLKIWWLVAEYYRETILNRIQKP